MEPWTRFEPRDSLLAALSLAYRLGMVKRALSWRYGLNVLPDHDRAADADSVADWLQDFLQAEAEVQLHQ